MLGLVLVAVAVDRDDAVGVFVDDDAVRVHAEGAHKVLEFFGAVYDLALIELVGQRCPDVGRELDAHADIDAVGMGRDAHIVADRLHPFAAAAADRDDAFLRRQPLAADREGIAALDALDALDRAVKAEIDLFFQLVIDVLKHDIVYVGAEVADLRVQQVQAVLEAHPLDLAVGRGIELGPLAAVAHVDLIDVLHELDGVLLADVLVERAAELVGDVVLAVGKGASAAEAAHDAAHRAADAGLHLFAVDRAFPFRELAPELHHADLQSPVGLGKLIGRKNAAGAGADNQNIIIHGVFLLNIKRKSPREPLRKAPRGQNVFYILD